MNDPDGPLPEPADLDFLPDEFPPRTGAALLLVAGAALVGGLTGILGVGFLFFLEEGTKLRGGLILAMAGWPFGAGWLAISLLVAGASALAAWMVERFSPTAGGSGVPYVEKILRTREQPRHGWVLPVKFFGGLLALSSGLVLGREGPMVQMGAVIGEKLGRLFPGMRNAWKPLMAAGAGAGLATAFNAPVGGTIFILEEVLRKVTPLAFVLSAAAATMAIYVQRGIFHMKQDYAVQAMPEIPAEAIWLFLLFGACIGLFGAGYNRLLMQLVSFAERLRAVPVAVRAAAVGFVIGSLAWFHPGWVGGGDDITQNVLNGRLQIGLFLGIAAVRFFIGPLSYVAGTPGGLFAPIIALGALLGTAAGCAQHLVAPELVPSPVAFAVAGMAAFFTATIRAPITGIVICMEMTGCYSLFFPVLATCLGAYLVPTLLKNVPLYDALAARRSMNSTIIKCGSMRFVQIASVVVLAILLAAAAPASTSETVVRETRCPEFQFLAMAPFTDGNGKPQTTSAYLWIPEKCRNIRGIVLVQQNVAEQGFSENAAIRQACRETDMAIVWFYPAFAPTFGNADQDGAIMQKALNELASISGYEEIATVPWLPFGHSTMGGFVQNLANWKPERCIAQIVFKSHVDMTLPNNRQIPLFELAGNFTEWNQQKKDWTMNSPNFWGPSAIGKDRATTHRPMSYLLECGSSHFVMTDTEADMIAMYIRKAVPARLPAGGGILKPADIDSGWVVDLDMTNPKRSPAQPAKSASDNARNGVWFFDKEMAKAVETLMNVNWTRKTQIPVILNNDGSIPAVQDNGLFTGVIPVAGEDGVTLTLKPSFLDRIPSNFTTGAGQALGHSGKGKIQIAWLGGNAVVAGPDTLRMVVDRRRTIYSSMIYVRHPGDDEYRPSIQPFGVGILMNKTGKPQTITFPEIPDQPAGTTQLELKAVSDAGLPVEYCVLVGPARVSGKTMTFTDIPPRSRFPIKVTVLAYQYGRSIEPAVQSAGWVERSFMLAPRASSAPR